MLILKKVAGPCLVHIRELPFSFGKLGGSVWYTAVALAQYLAMDPVKIKNKRILELGAGVGIPGIVASKCGAKSVTLSEFGFDGEVDGILIEDKVGDKRLLPSALLSNLKYNLMLNECKQATVRHLDWYDYSNNTTSLMSKQDNYDLIIGSDLVNWEDDVIPLIETLKYFLSSNSSCQALIALQTENRKAFPSFLAKIKEEFHNIQLVHGSIVHYDEHAVLFICIN